MGKCIVSEQYSIHLLRISCFSDLSLIVEELSCFSEKRSYTGKYALLLFFLIRQFNFLALRTYLVLLCFLHCPLNTFVCFLVLFSSCFRPLFFRTSPLITEVENISGDPRIFSCDVPYRVSYMLQYSPLYCRW